MSNFVNQFSEIGRLNTVMLHRPGVELEQLIPEYLERMLAEDTPHVPTAQKEHDGFKNILESHGVNVLYLEDLFVAVMESETRRKEFIRDYLAAARVQGESLKEAVLQYLSGKSAKELFYAVCRGVVRDELRENAPSSLQFLVNDPYPFVIDPIPNLYFTRDISICIGNGMIISSMSMASRTRETVLMRYVHRYHPLFTQKPVPLWYDYELGYNVEGGDVLILSDKTLAIGCSQRTGAAAIECIAGNVLRNGYERVLVFDLPKERQCMHLDVLFTMVDYDAFLVNPLISRNRVPIYELKMQNGLLRAGRAGESTARVLECALGIPAVRFIEEGGGKPILMEREHWNMGANSLAISPGNIITYNRNDFTNELLVKAGINVNPLCGSELSRGRGGPRCMSMPINRGV